MVFAALVQDKPLLTIVAVCCVLSLLVTYKVIEPLEMVGLGPVENDEMRRSLDMAHMNSVGCPTANDMLVNGEMDSMNNVAAMNAAGMNSGLMNVGPQAGNSGMNSGLMNVGLQSGNYGDNSDMVVTGNGNLNSNGMMRTRGGNGGMGGSLLDPLNGNGMAPMGVENQGSQDAVNVAGKIADSRSFPPFPDDQLTSEDLLPKQRSEVFNALHPNGEGPLDRSFLSHGYHIGINTQGQSLRNANLQFRSDPPNPQVVVSPWNQTTISTDINRRTLEIGSEC